MIEIKNIYKKFGEKLIINNISTTFEKGKNNLIIGKSGSGKTVLLKIIVGLLKINSGKIIFDKRIFTEMNSKEKKEIRQEIGMVFQGGALFDSETVEKNLSFPLDMFTNWSKKEKQNRINFCLERVNLKNSNHLFPSELSGGMQKRVAIARAIVLNPKYLFFDEPNSGLDPHTAIIINELISEITKEFQITSIINTHDINSVCCIGDKILFLSEGEKLWEGNKNEILNSENQKLNDFILASGIKI